MTITKLMRETLHIAHKQPLRRPMLPGPGAPPWPAPWQTILALERRGLLTRVVIRHNKGHFVWIWDLSEAGRLVLYPPPVHREEKPEWLSWTGSGSDWTQDPRRRADDGERMPEASEGWRRRAERARLGAQDRKVLARGLARQARRAA